MPERAMARRWPSGRLELFGSAANCDPLQQFAIGGLIVYGTDLADLLRRTGDYIDKILKGTKPADLPVEQRTKFELIINMKTAKALGLTAPPSILVRADEAVE
jgi:putative ABC transport system substrate-binding protein